jgi:hypothetical protein
LAAALKADDITTFVRNQATELGAVQAKQMVTALRGFFRYLRRRGDIEMTGRKAFPAILRPRDRSYRKPIE